MNEKELLNALWRCYEVSGADTDGMTVEDGPRAIRNFPAIVVEAVEDLRRAYESALEEIPYSDG